MKNKIVDDKKMISNPVRYGRCKECLKEGDAGVFNSRGWIVEGTVQKRYGDLWDYEPFNGYYIYLIQDIVELNYYGLEDTDGEYLEGRKKEERRKKEKERLSAKILKAKLNDEPKYIIQQMQQELDEK